jgi:Putative zinc-finger
VIAVVSYRCADVRAELGVYLLGTIAPAARDQVDRHLAGCSRCRDELASLAGLPALLRRVPDGQAMLESDPVADRKALAPPDALLSRAASVRRRNRWLAAAAAVALAAATAAASTAVVWARHEPGRSAASVWEATVHGTSVATGIRAWVRYAPRSWGTEVEARISGARGGTVCQLWVTGPGGQRVPAGSWTIGAAAASGAAASWYPASVFLPAASLHSFEITTTGGRAVVSIPGQVPGRPG